MSRYKKIDTRAREQDVSERNKDLKNDSLVFFAVAPETSVCFVRYLVALKEKILLYNGLTWIKTSLSSSGWLATDYHNNYRVFEMTIIKDSHGRLDIEYELLY